MSLRQLFEDVTSRQTELGEHTRGEFLNLGSFACGAVMFVEGYKSLKWGIPPIEDYNQFGLALGAGVLANISLVMAGGYEHKWTQVPRRAEIAPKEGEV